MKIVLLGANGKTGRLVMRQALAAGHAVTGVVRSAKSLSDVRHDRLTVRVGDVSSAEFLKTVFPGHDAVISTLGPRKPSKTACTIYSDSGAAIAEAMRACGMKRVLITSTALLFPAEGLLDRALRVIAKNNQQAAGLMETRVAEADLDYTFARPGFLTNGESAQFTKAAGAEPEDGKSISREALATFLVTEVEEDSHVRQVVGLSAKKAA